MNNIFNTPSLYGQHVCRCSGMNLQYFDADARHQQRMNALKSQLN